MKYLVYISLREPQAENIIKMNQIEAKRIEKGENWGDEILFPIHNIVTTGESFMIIETDDVMKLAKYRLDYLDVLGIEIYPIEKYDKIRELYVNKHEQVASV